MNSLSAPSGFFYYSNPTGSPTGEWTNWINCIGNSWSGTDRYGFQLANSFWNADLYVRRVQSGSWQSWNRIFHTGSADVRSPIFYDSNNTGYYVDPSSSSNLNTVVSYSYQGNGNVGGTGSAAWFPSGLYTASGATNWMYGHIYRAGHDTYGGGRVDATIVYDTNNTGYYADLNSTTYLY